MAITDATGRTEDVSLVASAIVNLLLSNTANQVFNVNVQTADTTIAAIDRVRDAIVELNNDVIGEIQEISDNIQTMVDFFQNRRGNVGGMNAGGNSGGGSGGGNNRRTTRPQRTTLAGAATGTQPVGPTGGGAPPVVPPGSRAVAAPGGGGRPNPNINPSTAGTTAALSGISKALTLIDVALIGVGRSAQAILGEFGVSIGGIFNGVVGDSARWQVNMAQIRWEQQGVVGTSKDIKSAYNDIGDVVAETGQNRVVFQEQYRKQVRQGQVVEMTGGKFQQRSLQAQQRLVKSSVASATILGTEVGQTVELFGEWNRHLGMTNNQINSISASMQQVGHITGVTGENLLKAAQSASQVGKEVFKYSGISDRAMANLIQQQAAFQKYGVAETGTKIQQMLAGGIKSFSAADPKMQAWMARSAGSAGISQSQLMSGAANDPAVMNKLMGSMMGNAQGFLKSQGMSGNLEGLTSELQKIQNIDPRRAMQLRENIQNIFGVGAGELQQLAKAQKEASKTPEQRIAELKEQRAGLTGAGSAARKQTIDEQIKQIESTDRRQALSQFSTQLQDAGGDINKAMQAFNAQTGKTMNIGDVQGLASQSVNDLASRAQKAGLDLTAELRKKGLSGTEELAQGLTGTNAEAMAGILQDVEGMVSVKERAKSDPVLGLQQDVNLINEKLKTLTEFFISGLGKTAMVALIAGMGALTVSGGLGVVSGMTGPISWLPKLFGAAGGAGGTVAAAAPAAAAAVNPMAGLFSAGTAATTGIAATAAATTAGTAATTAAAAGGLGTTAAAGGTTAGAAGATIGTGGIILIAAAILAATGAVVQGFQAGAKAAELFGVEQEKLTLRQKNAAEGAGVLSGALNWLTFGIFNKSLGPTGEVTKQLAIFFDKFWILGSLFSMVTNAARVIWGVLKGLWAFVVEVWDGIVDAVMSIVNPIIDLGKEIWDAIGDPIAELFNIFSGGEDVLADSVDIVESIVTAFRWVGRAIGDFLRLVGGVVGWFIKAVSPAIITAFQAIGWIISNLVPVLKNVWEALKTFFSGIWNIVAGLLTLDFRQLWTGLKQLYYELPQYVGKAMWALGEFALKALYHIVTKGLSMMWESLKATGGLIGKIVMGGLGLVGTVLKGIFYDFPEWLGTRMMDGLSAIWEDLPENVQNGLKIVYDHTIGALLNKWNSLVDTVSQSIAGFVDEWWGKLTAGISEWWNELYSGVTSFVDTFWADMQTGLAGLVDWLLSKLGLGGAVKGATETSTEQEATRKKEGDSFGHGVGGVVGGATNVLSGDFSEGFSKIGSGFGESISAVTNTIGGFLSSINPFELGTQEVAKEGIGYLHAGEAVIPSSVWKNVQGLIATGDPFRTGESKPEVTTGGNSFTTISTDIALENALSDEPKRAFADPANLGAFAEDQIDEASIFAGENAIQSMVNAGIAASAGPGAPSMIEDLLTSILHVLEDSETESLDSNKSFTTEKLESSMMSSAERLESSMVSATENLGSSMMLSTTQRGMADGANMGAFSAESIKDAFFGESQVKDNEYDFTMTNDREIYMSSMDRAMDTMSNVLADSENSFGNTFSSSIDKLSSIFDKSDETSSSFSDIKSDGIVSVLDRVASTITGSDKSVSSMMQSLGLFSDTQVGDAKDGADTSYISSLFSTATDSTILTSVAETLKGVFNDIERTMLGKSSVQNMGLFDPENASQTSESYMDSFTNSVTYTTSSLSNMISSMFGKGGDLNNAFDSAVSNISSNMGAGNLSKSLYLTEGEEYSSTVSRAMGFIESSIRNSETSTEKGDAGTYNAFSGDGDVSGGLVNSLSSAFNSAFSTKGQANTTMFTPESAEEYISAQVYGSKPVGADNLIPGMEGVLDYLSDSHDKKLDELIDVMKGISQKLSASGPSDILMPDNSRGIPATDRSGIKGWAKGRISGQWVGDQDNAYQAQQNATGDGMT